MTLGMVSVAVAARYLPARSGCMCITLLLIPIPPDLRSSAYPERPDLRLPLDRAKLPRSFRQARQLQE